jgi:phage/plasmid-like protein (TIGR03299 family)
MTDAVETMAWTGEPPWHGLGNKVANNLSPVEMLKAAGLDWRVTKQPLFWKPEGDKLVKVTNKFVLERETDHTPLSIVGKSYKEVQNEEAADFFKKYTAAGHMTMETMGSLWGGRYIWCLARVKADFSIGKSGDEVQSYLLLCQPHVIGRAMVIQFTATRVVCWNTLQMALGSNLRGRGGSAFRMPHSMKFDDNVKAQAELALGLAKERMTEFKEATQMLAKKRAKPEAVEKFFCQVLSFNPRDLVGKALKKDGKAREPMLLPKFREALERAPGQQMPTALGTWWGALNSVTFVLDHAKADNDKVGSALKSAWLGKKSQMKRMALDLALKSAAK